MADGCERHIRTGIPLCCPPCTWAAAGHIGSPPPRSARPHQPCLHLSSSRRIVSSSGLLLRNVSTFCCLLVACSRVELAAAARWCANPAAAAAIDAPRWNTRCVKPLSIDQLFTLWEWFVHDRITEHCHSLYSNIFFGFIFTVHRVHSSSLSSVCDVIKTYCRLRILF